MEYLDVLDENGNPTGEKKSREEVHNKGYWHACVHIWLVNSQGQVLLQKRSSNTRTYPSLWAYSAGGHVLAGEKSEDAVIREIKEEMGIEVSQNQIIFAFRDKNQDIENNNQLDYVYIVKKDLEINSLTLDPMEVEKVDWFELSSFEQLKRARDPMFVPKSGHYNENLFKSINNVLG